METTNKVLVGTRDSLYCISEYSASKLWEVPLFPYSDHQTQIVSLQKFSDNKVICKNESGELYLVDASDPSEPVWWSLTTSQRSTQVFVREEDMVLTVGDTLYYFPDKENRHQSERIEREIPTTKNSYIRNPVIFDDMIYVFTKTKILALHLGTLKTVWTESGENNKPIPSACTPVLSNGVLAYVRGGITSNFNKQGGNTYIVFVNCNTGEHICSFSFHTVLSQPVAISGIFFVQTGQGVYACYPRKNKRENVYDKALTPTVSHFTTDSSYVATRVCPFSLENIISGGFDLSWTADGAGDLVGPSSVSDSGVLYAASEDDNLVWAYSIQNGRQIYSHTSGEVWLHETGGSVITTAPVVL